MFLRKIDDGDILINNADEEYEKFIKIIKTDYDNGLAIKNPYYHIAIANDLVINSSRFGDKYGIAMDHFNKAIELDENCSSAAFAGKAWLLLKGKERLFF